MPCSWFGSLPGEVGFSGSCQGSIPSTKSDSLPGILQPTPYKAVDLNLRALRPYFPDLPQNVSAIPKHAHQPKGLGCTCLAVCWRLCISPRILPRVLQNSPRCSGSGPGNSKSSESSFFWLSPGSVALAQARQGKGLKTEGAESFCLTLGVGGLGLHVQSLRVRG